MAKKNKRYHKINLTDLSRAVDEDCNVEISNDENDVRQASQLIVIKRDGRKEPYMPLKMRKVSLWACDGNDIMADELLNDTEIKLHDEIKVSDMYKQLVVTAVNKIGLLNTTWEYVAEKLVLLEMYKESWNIKDRTYPHLKSVIEKGIEYKIYDKDTYRSYSDEEYEILNSMMRKDSDFIFNFKGLTTFYDKYCINYTKTKKLELPQHVYLRVSMALMVKETDRLSYINKLYNVLSNHEATLATPIMLNAGTPGQQLSSCVLNALYDDTHSILDSNKNLGIYSKFKGGTALDISHLRAKGSYIVGNQGYSSGPVPFVKIIESTMKAFNQGGKRPGSCVITYQWWHYDFNDLIVLKSNGGTDDNRARGLKYTVKLNRLLIDRVMKDEDITLFDPKEVKDLLDKYGEDFDKAYVEYESKSNIKKRKIKARDLWYRLMKERTETGNIYLFHEENVNEQSMLNRYINSSNLCAEIVLPSRPSVLVDEELYTMENGKKRISKHYEAGEIALCNLASYNLEKWHYMSYERKVEVTEIVVRALDNTVDLAVYPVKEGKNSNMMYRYLGIGVMNQTNYLALNKIVIDTQEALEEIDRLFDDISYLNISASCKLAKEKGRFEKFYETKWAKGVLPIDNANKKAIALTAYNPNMERWDRLRVDIMTFGLRNAALMAIAPTACQTKDSEIMTNDGIKSLESIMNECGIDHNTIEENSVQGWFEFDKSITIPTRYGDKEVNRIWYNGKQPTKTITFEDGKSYTFTLNHRLLVNDGGVEKWVYVNDLTESMDVVKRKDTKDAKSLITKITENYDLKHTWDIEVPDVHEYLLSNGCVSHNTSGKAVNAIESIEPVSDFFYKEEGTMTIPTVVPNFRINNLYYKKAFDCQQQKLIEGAAVRQKWVDQSQSINVYIARPDSMVELTYLHVYAFDIGVKTFYYLKQLKDGESEICESCS